MRLEAGFRLGPYEIIGPIGAGGMGEVYRARDTRLGREVAIKVLPHELTTDRDRLMRFEREARSSSALNHRNIVTIHDFTSRDGEAWLVMELIRGESLRDALSRGPLPLKKLLAVAAGIADGLAAAHEAGIVHRDLKPENVMINTDGTPKILDFGLVKQAPANDTNSPTDMHATSTGMVLGTAAYMSPEQARGQNVDYRTDQFSLGLMLHEMANGTHPFRRASGLETMSAILNDEPAPLDGEFPDQFLAIVERCLEKTPPERYGSTSDLAHDLGRLRDRSGPYVTISRRKPARKVWPAVVVGIISIAAILALFTLATWGRKETGVADPIQAAVPTPELAVQLAEVAVPIVISPDGRYLVVLGAGPDGRNDLSLHDLRTGAVRTLAENAYAPGWSSDSKAVAYFADGKLRTVSIDGGPPRIVCDARPEGTPSWSGDNILYEQYSKDPGLYLVNASGGAPKRLIAAKFSHALMKLPWFPEFLPDGKRFLALNIINFPGQTQVNHELIVGSLDGTTQKVEGSVESRAIFVDGQVMFVRDGTLMLQPFDIDKARFTGVAKPIVDSVYYFRNTGNAAFTVSRNGVLAWCSPRKTSHVAWFDRTGVEGGSIGTASFNGDGRLSPDGTRYAACIIDQKAGSGDVWIYDLARESAQRLTFSTFDEKAPVWSPDGQTIYYRADGSGPPDIFRWRLGEDHGALLFRGPEVEEPQDVSPDGKWLLYVGYTSVGSDVKLLPLDPAGPPRPLVATPFNELSPRFSPDGKSVAYSSDVSGRPEVYVRPFEGSAASIRISKDGGSRPRWNRNGRELFFLAPGGRVMSATVGGDLDAGAPRMLFQAADAVDFEPSRDGLRFLVQVEEGSGDPPVHLLINWPALLTLKP